MGGLLAADSLLEFLKTRPDQEAPLWPNIVACIAFDTPVSITILSSTADSLHETPVVPGAPPVCFQEQRRSSCRICYDCAHRGDRIVNGFRRVESIQYDKSSSTETRCGDHCSPCNPACYLGMGSVGSCSYCSGQRSCSRRCSRGSLLPARHPWRRLQMVCGPYEVRWDLVE